ncbi:MAG: ABC transporter permease, partial [Calditrichaeota bacterium]|nr:ABC transporter permease [Calditrichota bacterium]
AEPLKHNSNTQGILGPVLAEEVPGIAAAVRMIDQQLLLRYGDRQYQESRVIAADGEFFRLFSYPLLQGDPQTALRAPGSIVLTAAAAQKYWGNENPIGKTLIVNNQYELTVTGLLAEPPRNSSFNFEMLISMSTLERGAPDWMFKNWAAFNFQTYVLLQENANPGQVETNFPGLLDK